jgi:hypothetical protein
MSHPQCPPPFAESRHPAPGAAVYPGPQQPYSPPVQPYPYPLQQYPHAYPAVPSAGEPIFQVKLIKHTGMAIAWWQHTYLVRGTYDQCLRAIREAQNLNLIVGWWSVASLLLLNWIALGSNVRARRTLCKQAAALHQPPTPAPQGGGMLLR